MAGSELDCSELGFRWFGADERDRCRETPTTSWPGSGLGATVTTVELKISSRSQDDVAVVTVGGEIDLYTAPQLRNELVEALEAGARRLVIDMSRAGFCDSTGISVLLSAMKRSRDRGGDLELVAPGTAVMKVLQVTGLDEVFVIHPDLDALPVAAGTGTAQ